MRIFVKYNQSGEILSVSKVEVMPADVSQPYQLLSNDEFVVELPAQEALMTLAAMELHETFKIDPKTKVLVKKTG